METGGIRPSKRGPVRSRRLRPGRLVWSLGKRAGTELVRQFAPRRGPYSRTGEESVIAGLVADVAEPARFYVDIGAGDGVNDSNTYALAKAGWRGLAIDSSGAAFAALAGAYQTLAGVQLHRGKVEPGTAVNILAAADVPEDFALLSLDIDGYDYFVLDAILEAYRPALACVEINEKIPPPVRFTVLYRADYSGPHGHFYGQSITQLAGLAARHRYEIVHLEYNNAFLVPAEHNRLASLTPEQAYREGYSERTDRLARFPWNADMEYLRWLTPQEAVAAINESFKLYQGEFLCEV